MILAVKLYSAVPASEKPAGIPNSWPAQVIELGDSTKPPDDSPWLLMNDSDYLAYRASKIPEYVAWASTYYAVSPISVISAKIQKAMDFGKALTIQFASENVLMGITQANKTIPVADCLQRMAQYVSSGSLYAAAQELDNLVNAGLDPNLAPFITADRLNLYKTKILAFLQG